MYARGDRFEYVGPSSNMRDWEWEYVSKYAHVQGAGWFKYRGSDDQMWQEGWVQMVSMKPVKDPIKYLFVHAL